MPPRGKRGPYMTNAKADRIRAFAAAVPGNHSRRTSGASTPKWSVKSKRLNSGAHPYKKKSTSTRSKFIRSSSTQEELSRATGNFSLGRKLSTIKETEKLVAANKQSVISRFGGMQPFQNTTAQNVVNSSPSVRSPCGWSMLMTGGGFFPLFNTYNNSNSATNNVTWKTEPMHIYDITSTNNIIGGSSYEYTPGWSLGFMCPPAAQGTASNVIFSKLCGQNNSGIVESTAWLTEDGLGSATLNAPIRRDLLNYVNAKLLLYAPAKMVTDYKIELVQLKDDYLHPEFIQSNSNVSSTADFNKESISFWQAYCSKSLKHPIASTNPEYHKHVKVLKSLNITMQPRSSSETDAAVGHTKVVNIFSRLNRICKYDWLTTGLDNLMQNQSSYPVQNGSCQNVVEPRARIYLTIQALTPTSYAYNFANSTSGTVDYNPSYDILLRTKHTSLD